MANTLLFIDTNIFLDFYRVPQSDLSLEVFDFLLEHSDLLIISDQVKMEFQKNRNNTIQGYMNLLPMDLDKKVKAPVLLSGTKKAEEIKQCANKLQRTIKELKDILNGILLDPNHKDDAYKSLMQLFEVNNLYNSGKQKIELSDSIFLKAIRRFHRGMPPRKNHDLSIGDAINWEWCLYCCSYYKPKHSLIIVSNDKDFADSTNENKINPVLKDEFRERVGKSFSVRLEHSLKKAIKDIKLEMPKSVEEELDRIQLIREIIHKGKQCCRCGAPAMFDAYCKKCDELVVGDADGEKYYINGEKVFEMDPVEGNGELLHCPHCRNTKMRIEYTGLCSYCQHMADKIFDDD